MKPISYTSQPKVYVRHAKLVQQLKIALVYSVNYIKILEAGLLVKKRGLY